MNSLISLVLINLKIIYRSKMSFLLILIAPMLIVFLVGTAFSSDSLENINIAVYSESYSDLTYEIIEEIEKKDFRIDYKESKEGCIGSVRQGINHVCITFPYEMSLEGDNEPVLMHVDKSRLNLAYILINQIEEKISSKGSELGITMADDLLKLISEIKISLPEQKTNLEKIRDGLDKTTSKSNEISSSLEDTKDSIKKIDDTLKIIDSIENKTNKINDVEDNINSIKSTIKKLENNLIDLRNLISDEITTGKTTANINIEKINKLILKINSIGLEDAEKIVVPIKTELVPIGDQSSNWRNMFPTLVAIVILLSSIVLASSLALTDRRAKSKFRNFLTPTSDLLFILGPYITGVIILALQLGIFFSGTYYLTHLSIIENFWSVVLVIFLTLSVFLFLGMLIGYLFKSDETTILVSISIASLLIFFSNTIVPVESIRGYFKYIAIYNPLFISDSMLKKLILFQEPLYSMLHDILLLLGIAIGLMMLTLLSRKLTKKWA